MRDVWNAQPEQRGQRRGRRKLGLLVLSGEADGTRNLQLTCSLLVNLIDSSLSTVPIRLYGRATDALLSRAVDAPRAFFFCSPKATFILNAVLRCFEEKPGRLHSKPSINM